MVVTMAFAPIIVMLALITFLIAFQTDLPSAGSPAQGLLRARPGMAVSAPFPNCRAAFAAGATPVYRGDPGYGPHLDGNGDGIACY
jgi:excalibur calcium-binding domain-containing protein